MNLYFFSLGNALFHQIGENPNLVNDADIVSFPPKARLAQGTLRWSPKTGHGAKLVSFCTKDETYDGQTDEIFG